MKDCCHDLDSAQTQFFSVSQTFAVLQRFPQIVIFRINFTLNSIYAQNRYDTVCMFLLIVVYDS
jgi:hypothetical protein